MATKITTKQYKRVDLVEVSGRIDSNTAPQLEQVLQKIVNEGRYHIVVDLNETDFMSSAGLRSLLAALKQVRRFNRGDLRIASPSNQVRKVFDMAGLLEVFTVYDNTVDAVGSF